MALANDDEQLFDEVKLESDDEANANDAHGAGDNDQEEELFDGDKEEDSGPKFKDLEVDDMVIESDDEVESDKTLNLAKNNLTEIPADIAQDRGPNTKTLILTNNPISSLSNLEHFTMLETLQLDRCVMQSIDDMPKMPYLRTLWLNNNKLDDLQKLLHVLTKNCPRLTYLSLLRNPICPSIYFKHGNEAKYKRFRFTVLYHLHGLTYLDTTEVTIEERKEAMEKGKFLVIKKPTKQQMKETEEQVAPEDHLPAARHKQAEPAAFLGKGRIKYDGRESEGNRFIMNHDL